MDNFEKLKFITEDDEEYIIINKMDYQGKLYGYAINLKDKSDSMFVNIMTIEGELIIEQVTDTNLINNLVKRMFLNN